MPADAAFALPPIVQYVSETSAIIDFELDAPSAGALLYRPAGGEPHTSLLAPDRTYYQITLADLSPATTYEYAVRIGADGDYRQPLFAGAPWGNGTFHTPPYGPPLRIAVIGDSGFGDPVTATLASQMAAFHPDFVIHTGDVVYDMEEDSTPLAAFTRKFFLPFAPLLRQAPIYPVVGNHDVFQETFWQGAPFYYYAFPPLPDGSTGRRQWYALAFGDVQFVMLDTQTFFGEEGGAEQQTWLAERLFDPRYAITIPVFHVPPYSNGLHPGDGRPVQSSWVPLFEAANVPLVLCGHEHYYERLIVGGVTYVTSGGGSATLYVPGEPSPGSQIAVRLSHFVSLEIYPDRIALQAIDVSGWVIDQAIIPLD
jgi:predicted phosphodiesterase